MIGYFIAAERGNCDDCGRTTRRGERVYHDDGGVDGVEKRLCAECAG